MGAELTLPLILQLVGVVVIIAEIILPSGGILSLLATAIIGYSLYYVFHELSVSTGWVFVAADAVIIPVLVVVGLKLLARSPVTLRKSLSKEDGVVSQSLELDACIGKEGVAVSDLRPSGTAVIGGKRVDVVSRGEYLEKGATIIVSAVTGNQIIVRKKESN